MPHTNSVWKKYIHCIEGNMEAALSWLQCLNIRLSNMHSARVLIEHIPRMECQHVCCGWNSCSQNVLHPKLHHVQLRTYMEHYNARIAIECIQNGHEAFTRIDNKCCPLPNIIWPEIHKSFHCMWEPWAPGPLRNEVSVKCYGLTSRKDSTLSPFCTHFCFHSIISLLNSTDLVWKVVEELAAGRPVLWHAMVLIDVLHFLNWYIFLLFRLLLFKLSTTSLRRGAFWLTIHSFSALYIDCILHIDAHFPVSRTMVVQHISCCFCPSQDLQLAVA